MMMAGTFRPPFLFLAPQKEKRAADRSKEKKRFGGSVRASADLLPPAGEGWPSLAAVRDGNALPLGSSKPGEVSDTVSADFRCRWPSLAGQGPTHRSAPTKRWEALTFRRGRPACPPVGKAPRGTMKRQRGQKQGPCDFPPRRPPHRIRGSRPGKMSGSARAGRRPEVLPAPTRETLVRAEGHCTGARQKSGLFFWTGPRPIFFSTRLKRKWGAECLSQHPG